MKWQLLHRACFEGDAAEVARLLDAGANPNQVAPTNWRQTPLGRTLEFRVTQPKHSGHTDVVKILLTKGADPAARSTQLDMTPFELASFCGLGPAAELLRPGHVNASQHPAGMSDFWIAAASRLPESDRLAHRLPSAEIDSPWRGATPLMMAAGHAKNFAVADLLLASGASPNAGVSMLHASCDWHFEHLLPSLRYLAHNGWNVNGCDAEGQSAAHKAALLGYSVALRKLKELGADLTAADRNGQKPIDIARRWRKAAAIKELS